jgi:hypothetical protein
MFDISTYNDKRTKEELFEWLSEWASEIVTLDDMRKLFDRDRDTKIMFEEALGIGNFINRFYPNRNVSVELRNGNQNFDAIVYGENNELIEYLEITCVPQKDDHKLRKEYAETGQYSLATRLSQNPSYLEYSNAVSEGIKKKLAKSYPTPTTLLVTLSPDLIVEEDETFVFVIEHLDSSLISGDFERIVIFDLPGTHWHVIN